MMDLEFVFVVIFWVVIVVVLITRGKKVNKGRPQKGFHPTTVNKSISSGRQQNTALSKT